MIKMLKDNLLLTKESLKTRLFNNHRPPLAGNIIRHLGLKSVEKVICGKPNTLIIITKNLVIRIPLDRLSMARCRLNKIMLKRLNKTDISQYVPYFVENSRLDGQDYYCEERLNGAAIGIPLAKMDDLTVKAADFITGFHLETAKDIVINESYFKRLVSRELKKLSSYLCEEYKIKLLQIESLLKKQLFGKRFKTVWFQGDYKIENILFDTKRWQIKGIIDWDLSRKEGLPLLDILFLLAYQETIVIEKGVVTIFKNRFLNTDFNSFEKEVISKYLSTIKISEEFIRPMLIMFWLNHIVHRYRSLLSIDFPTRNEWMHEKVYNIIDTILN